MKKGGVDQNLIEGAKILAKTQGTGGVTLGGAITGGITSAIDEVFNDPAKSAKFQENVQNLKDERAENKGDKVETTGDAIISATEDEQASEGSPVNMLGTTPIKMLFQANKNKNK